MIDDKDWVAESKARCEAATPGEWMVIDYDGWNVVRYEPLPEPGYERQGGKLQNRVLHNECNSVHDACFIAAARTDLPRALAVVEAADRLVEYVEAMLDMSDAYRPGLAEALAAYHAARG